MIGRDIGLFALGLLAGMGCGLMGWERFSGHGRWEAAQRRLMLITRASGVINRDRLDDAAARAFARISAGATPARVEVALLRATEAQ